MEKGHIIGLVVLILVIASLLVFRLTSPAGDYTYGEEPEDLECTSDSECVPKNCCHPDSCVPSSQGPVCDGVICTLSCEPGTLDCGQGSCGCVNSKCEAVFN
jgi:hypothetical protein